MNESTHAITAPLRSIVLLSVPTLIFSVLLTTCFFAAERPLFTDVTAASGIEAVGRAHAVAVEDFDGDGKLDIIIGGFNPPYIQCWRDEGDLRFSKVADIGDLNNVKGAVSGIGVADYDNDGRLDLYVCVLREGRSSLFHNDGGFHFADVGKPSGTVLADPERNCAFADVDRDGWLDFHVVSPKGPNHLFRNNHDGTFTDLAPRFGMDLPANESLGCVFADLNDNGYPALFVANYNSQVSRLYENVNGQFRDVTEKVGLGLKASTVGCVFTDVNGDGRPDLLVTTDSWLSGVNSTEAELKASGRTVEPNQLYLNLRSKDGSFTFVRVDDPALAIKTLCHDASVADFDNDGWPEIYVGVDANTANKFAASKGGNRMFRFDPDGQWADVAKEWGVYHEANCVCVPAADVDNDGDLDLLLVNFYSNVVLYRNGTNNKAWLSVRCEGSKSNRRGIGGEIRITDGDRLIGYREIVAGDGYCTSRPLEAHFGLGTVESVDVDVTFPFGTKVVKQNVRAGTRLLVRE